MRDEMADLALAIIAFALCITIGYSFVTEAYKQTSQDSEIVLQDKNTSDLQSDSTDTEFGNRYYDIVDTESIMRLAITVQNKNMYGPKRLYVFDKVYQIDDLIEDNLSGYVRDTNKHFDTLVDYVESGALGGISDKSLYDTYKNALSVSTKEEDININESALRTTNLVMFDRNLTEYMDEVDRQQQKNAGTNKDKLVTDVSYDWDLRVGQVSNWYVSGTVLRYNNHNYKVKVRYVFALGENFKNGIGEDMWAYEIKALFYLDEV